ncbi:glucans biosynthesis glucosyltransferase MdoH [Limibaculum sp. M0105]|uniref:Glucans biosynthesis glucosyltransferase H n=1 Tax=Thermohalobaculum xanthum TaxID=2753746 RepID=A0A8J7M4Z0_9RHOB|nr:glucans biosynthesis glucosyltransferase MdoH [Thermohalobaculum xanthum]MBK0398318.1 glucans biosynthesis glucosyltransferase MdoH [Thermohalobaculum xanthum]
MTSASQGENRPVVFNDTEGAQIRKPDFLHAPTPPSAPLEMPTQDLARGPIVAFPPSSLGTAFARLIAFGGAAVLTAYGFNEMLLVFGKETRTFLQLVLLGLFTITFGWIALSATQTIAGLLCAPGRPDVPRDGPLKGRTAILMPVYNESPASTCGALAAMGEAQADSGHGTSFEIFILSDTRDPDVWLAETAAFAELRHRLAGRIAVWYRRRWQNTGKKAGNLHDFMVGWGARYDYMLVLDADSLMDAPTIIEMVRRMDAAPRLGILQTVPILAGGSTLFARLQQFAGRIYGPVIARGVAAWQGMDGNYWGHNALIRVRAFAENCGLPELPGRKPFGGHILSHDFVEASLIRRGGWEVRMDPDLEGSWEGSPPSLLDLSTRDRRWAQGNLQHSKIVGAHRLRLPNRIHMLIGIGAYLMSTIWLAMLLVGMVLTAQTLLIRPEYFPDGLQLFPDWPVFDAERMRRLFMLAMTLLLLPKAVGLCRALLLRRVRSKTGGAFRLIASAVFEVVLSALYAPVLMLLQARHVTDILLGRDSGWGRQQREGAELSWPEALAHHWTSVVAGLTVGAAFAWFAPNQVIWITPVLAGLILAPALSRWSSARSAASWVERAGLLTTPEETSKPALMQTAHDLEEEFEALASPSLEALADDRAALAAHLRALGPEPDWTESQTILRVTLRAKIEAAASPAQAVRWLSPAERDVLVGSADLLRLWGARWDEPAPSSRGALGM